jgi:hypothetical protein
MTTTQVPQFVTTIDQHRGNHSSGMRYMKLTEVRTEWAGLGDGWDDMTPDEQEAATATLADIHAAEVELASCDSDVRQRANELLPHIAGITDFDYAATAIREAIAEACDAD